MIVVRAYNPAVLCCQCVSIGAVAYTSSTDLFGQGRDPVFLSSVQCTGSEANLLQCPDFSSSLDMSCINHEKDVGVKCQGQLVTNMCIEDIQTSPL